MATSENAMAMRLYLRNSLPRDAGSVVLEPIDIWTGSEPPLSMDSMLLTRLDASCALSVWSRSFTEPVTT